MAGLGKTEEVAAAIEEVLELHNLQVDAYEKELAGEGDFSGMLAKTENRLKELQGEAETMLENMGMTREQLNAYVSNRANFSPDEWELLENTKKTCEQIRQQGQQIVESRIPKELREVQEKPKVIATQKKKKKRPVQRKDWLQM